MVKITESTIIDRSVEEVWRFVSDPSNSPKMVSRSAGSETEI
jgi:hypothetical protein